MSGKGIVGWLILAVALAVPGFMFLNWWRLLNNHPQEHPPTVSAAVFGTTTATNLTNPLSSGATSATDAGTGASSASAPAAPQGAVAAPASLSVPGGAPAPSAAPAPAARAPAPAAAAAATPAPEAQADPASIVRYDPKTDRDPTLSPMDVKRIAQQALEADFEAQRRKREAERARRRTPAIESSTKLYGITAVRGSISAIVNDEVVHAGDVLRSGVRIVRITPTTVTFQHGGRRWTRTMSR